jgi:2-keto-4-pentenoate hydratase/2-oxohepta-3-ene-1,7-dioic acid hydratase in catechol pathway
LKYGRFLINGDVKYGMVDVDRVIELTGPFLDPHSAPTDRIHDLNAVKVLAPVLPKQIIAIGLNYKEHAKELGYALPEDPLMFMVSPSSIIGPEEAIQLAKPDHQIEFEAELVIVIGKEAYRVKEEEALSVVFGYTIGVDVSDRNIQKQDGQFMRAKSFLTYKPIGPFIETAVKPQKLSIQLKQNGVLKQDGHTSDMIHTVEKIIAAVTDVMVLEPGDIIFTGTPKGVGPLSPGDILETTIDGIGTLKNRVE